MRRAVKARLAEAGFVAPEEEAEELAAATNGDPVALEEMVRRRLTGEPLAWITGYVRFCDLDLRVAPGVYVPRPHTELLARRAAGRLPPRGTAIDVCTGTGAIARVLTAAQPDARVIATDLDDRAVACARANGVDARRGDLLAPIDCRADVVVAVVPYVPTPDLPLLQRDTFTFETPLAYDGGPDGTAHLRRAIAGAARVLRPGGTLLLELGAGQPELLADDLQRHGYTGIAVLHDEDGDVRGLEATCSRPYGSGP